MLLNNVIVDRLGYYKVGESKIFTNKITALMEATRTKEHVSWAFNDDTFSKFDWLTTPTLTLKEVYKNRALQLREKYDYLVLNYSGGSDSHNILHTFLENNIRLDEILVRWPRKRTQQLYTPSVFSTAYNQLSEWDLAILPDMKWVAANYPNIHIEFYDYSDDTFDFFKTAKATNDPWFDVISGTQLSPTHAVRWRTNLDRYQKLFYEKGVTGCHIFGTDKPRVCFKDNNFFAYYLDTIAGTPTHFGDYQDKYSALELFYWTPDMPEVVKVQSHAVMNFFKKNPGLLPVISPNAALSYTLRNTYETLIRSIVYPYWDFSRFQAAKPARIVYCEYDDWVHNKDATEVNSINEWKYSIEYIDQNVDDKFINRDHTGAIDGMVGMVTPFYQIGSLCNNPTL